MASSTDSVSLQTVKLKVLYTFDAEQKDNHLARWPQSLEIQTAFIDETTQIGIIDLRTCLEAVTTASPELLARLDGDYTVYAHDYTEPDVPLVGQGMLSQALAGQDGSQDGGNEAMITGRITKNILGLFSSSAQQTLEVKLRLTPVTTFPHQRFRSGSISGQDAGQQWSQGASGYGSPRQQRAGSPMDTVGLENMQRIVSEGIPPRERSGSYVGEPLHHFSQSRPSSRPTTPTLAQQFNPPGRQGMISRPSSRAETRPPQHDRRESFNSGYYSAEENLDDGPTRKRAKITKVDYPTKSNFNIERQPDSLRVVASTASSVRIHRPIAINPIAALQAGTPTEEPVRPPTPVPTSKYAKPRGRPRKIAPSSLVYGARARNSSPGSENHANNDMLDASLSSPEETRAPSASSTPADIPSSPPVMPEKPSLITSPALPPMMDNPDSGFMSGSFEDLFGDDPLLQFDDFIMDKPQDQQTQKILFNQTAASSLKEYAPVFDEGNEIEGPTPTIETRPIQPTPLLQQPRPLSRAQSFNPVGRVAMSSPKLAPAPIPRARQILEEQRAARAQLPPIPASDPAGRSLHRANTWAPDMSDVPMSEAFAGDDHKPKPASKKKVGKEQTRARLENAIAAGQMPPFCDNCGAIETPAWRRAYSKVFNCAWDDVETSLDHGACCYKEPIEYNDDGSIKTFKGYKTERRADDKTDEWVQVCLCNPCGLWFHKQKCPRPREKWQKRDPKEKRKRKRAPKPPKNPNRPNGFPNAKSDAPTPASDDSSPADTATEAPDGEDNDLTNIEDEMMDDTEPQLPPMPRNIRANSAEPVSKRLRHRHHQKPGHREVHSSPGGVHGSDMMPIEIDLTPKPLRRQLFPSPGKPQIRPDQMVNVVTITAPSHLPAFVRRSPRLNKTRDISAQLMAAANMVTCTIDGKENIIPSVAIDSSIDHLFDEPEDTPNLEPSTPTSKRRSDRLLFKTPSKTPQRHFGADLSPNARDSPSSRSVTRKQLHHPVVTALLGTVKKDISEMTPFTRSIHEAFSDAPEIGVATPQGAMRSDRVTRSSKKSTPNKSTGFDFPDLPSLNNSSPMGNDNLFNFNFSELTTDQLHTDFNEVFSTDAPMPSSPPIGLFNFINTEEDEFVNTGMWANLDLTGGQSVHQSSYPDPSSASLAVAASQTPRRSPRKRS